MEYGIWNLEVKENKRRPAKRAPYAHDYGDMRVFQIAYDASLAIHKCSLNFPKIEQFSLADQLRRATKSLCANLVEGYSKQTYSRPEFKRFISMSIGSCGESRMWLRYSRDLGYITSSEFSQWEETYTKVANMLRKLHGGIK